MIFLMKKESKKGQKGKVWFVAHPYKPAPVYRKEICAWNIGGGHRRKMITSDCANYIDDKGILHSGQKIFFVGEWECCSEVTKNEFKEHGVASVSHIHKPFLTEYDNLPQVMNTDPFVFGEKFYYTCCKIDESMQSCDIVIFGSYKKNNTKEIIVDTVLVLGEWICLKKDKSHKFPTAYYNATLCKQCVNGVWTGLMYSENKNIFSFVPCKTTADYELPTIVVEGLKGAQNIRPKESDDIQVEFDNIKNQLLEKGYLLGIEMELPKFRELNEAIIIKNIQSTITELSKQSTKKVANCNSCGKCK